MVATNIAKTLRYLKNFGLRDTIKKVLNYSKDSSEYDRIRGQQALTEEELQAQRDTEFAQTPLFSFIIPLYCTDGRWLTELIDSIKAQTYGNFEVCFSDGSPVEKRSAIKSNRQRVCFGRQI